MENTAIYYCLSFSYLLFILTSFLGWGSLLARILFPKKIIDWGQLTAWGVALTILIGGILNVFMVVSKPVVIIYLSLGIVHLFTLEFPAIKNAVLSLPVNLFSFWKSDKVAFLGVFVIICILLFYCYAALWHNLTFDDNEAYAMFPKKMLEQGGLGYEPFCERRMFALGGQSFLHVLVLSVLGLYSLHSIDRGIAYVLAIALLWGLSRKLKVPARSAVLVCVSFLIIPVQLSNVTSFVMAFALMVALFQTFDYEQENDEGNSFFPRAFITALLLSAILASKSTYLIFCTVYLLAAYGVRIYFLPRKIIILKELLAVMGLIVLFLLPWMISSYQSSATLLYPILGRGYNSFWIAEYPPMTLQFFIYKFCTLLYTPYAFFSGILLVLFIIRTPLIKRRLWACVIFVSAFIGAAALYFYINIGAKYDWPIKYAALSTLMMLVLSEEFFQKNVLIKKMSWACIIFFLPWLLKFDMPKISDFKWNHPFFSNQEIVMSGSFNRSAMLSRSQESLEYLQAQKAVPEGETIVTRVTFPAALDFRRNKILVVDWGNPGPKPGIPLSKGAEAVAQYLLSNNIRYIMFSYKDWGPARHASPNDFWVKLETDRLRQFEEKFFDLGKTRKKIYDDGRIYVLDLRNPVIP